MRAAIISDVHSNLAALETVLSIIEAEQVDELWCLGDLVGYGADPERCVEILMDRCDVTLAGNHDLVVAGSIDMSVFTHDAGTAARWTAKVLSETAMEQLKTLRSLRRAERGRALPRQHPRPDLGVRGRPAGRPRRVSPCRPTTWP